MNLENNIGILLMGYGGPHSLEEVEPYLAQIKMGKPFLPNLSAVLNPRKESKIEESKILEEIKERYRLIGGKSPIFQIITAQGILLQRRLTELGFNCYVEVGMRHWTPSIKKGISSLIEKKVKKIIGIPMVPYYSKTNTEAYISLCNNACEELNINAVYIRDWHLSSHLIDGFVKRIKEEDFNSVKTVLVFTAHSLPIDFLENDAGYENSLRETAYFIARTLNLSSRILSKASAYELAFQSRGKSRKGWLGPQVEETLKKLATKGIQEVLIVPIGFLCDNMEILYDIDIYYKKYAQDLGINLRRSQSLNTHPSLIEAMAELVRDVLRGEI